MNSGNNTSDTDKNGWHYENPPEYYQALDEARERLVERCDKANLEWEEDDLEDEGMIPISFVYLPCGRKKYRVDIGNLEDLQKFLRIPFERYVLLGDYVAVASYKDGQIEALIADHHTYNIQSIPDLAHQDNIYKSSDSSKYCDIDKVVSGRKIGVSIGHISDDLQLIGNISDSVFRPMSLKLTGLPISQHDQAVDLLERISDSFFFQINMISHNSISLQFREDRSYKWFIRKGVCDRPTLDFPSTEYDKPPMALYRYASSARGQMPLVEFLGYYQCIEYYFPLYSEVDAKKSISNILKDPAFRYDRDSDLARLLSAIKLSHNKGFGNELSQLKSTFRECVNNTDLMRYIKQDKEQLDFLSTKSKLTDKKISRGSNGADLISELSERIYDIRCRIVHAKNELRDSNINSLLPFSEEVDLLLHDNNLIRYIAQRVLIASSSTLRI